DGALGFLVRFVGPDGPAAWRRRRIRRRRVHEWGGHLASSFSRGALNLRTYGVGERSPNVHSSQLPLSSLSGSAVDHGLRVSRAWWAGFATGQFAVPLARQSVALWRRRIGGVSKSIAAAPKAITSSTAIPSAATVHVAMVASMVTSRSA